MVLILDAADGVSVGNYVVPPGIDNRGVQHLKGLLVHDHLDGFADTDETAVSGIDHYHSNVAVAVILPGIGSGSIGHRGVIGRANPPPCGMTPLVSISWAFSL